MRSQYRVAAVGGHGRGVARSEEAVGRPRRAGSSTSGRRASSSRSARSTSEGISDSAASSSGPTDIGLRVDAQVVEDGRSLARGPGTGGSKGTGAYRPSSTSPHAWARSTALSASGATPFAHEARPQRGRLLARRWPRARSCETRSRLRRPSRRLLAPPSAPGAFGRRRPSRRRHRLREPGRARLRRPSRGPSPARDGKPSGEPAPTGRSDSSAPSSSRGAGLRRAPPSVRRGGSGLHAGDAGAELFTFARRPCYFFRQASPRG